MSDLYSDANEFPTVDGGAQSPPCDPYLPLWKVKHITSLSRTGLYEGMAEGTFPLNYQLSRRRVGWKASEVHHWMSTRAKKERPR